MSAEAGVDHARPEIGSPPEGEPRSIVPGVAAQAGVPARYVADGKVVEGRGGRLFLANDDNHAFEQFTGERPLEEWKLEFWGKVLARRNEILRELGASYSFLVAPDSHPVYPELLPEGVEAGAQRPVEQLMSYVERAGVGVPIVYPVSELRAEDRDGGLVYPLTDTHWNDLGGFVAYESLLDVVERAVPVRRVRRSQVIFYDHVVEGDLGFKLDPVRSSPYAIGVVRQPSARMIHDNTIEGTGGLVITECPAAPPVTCVLFGDSYTYALLKFLSESFGRLVFGHTPWMDLDLIDRERPAVVISLMVERHLVGVPNDLDGERLEASAARKLGLGRLRPRLEHWIDSAAVLSPGTVERVRAHLLEREDRLTATIVSVIAYAGLRPREALKLRWSDVGDGELLVRGSPRTVQLLEPLADDLRQWRAMQRPARSDQLVFPRLSASDGNDLRAWKRDVLYPAFQGCGLRARSANNLHRTFAALLLHGGIAPREVAKQADMPKDVFAEQFAWQIAMAQMGEPASPAEQIEGERYASPRGSSRENHASPTTKS